MLLTQPVPLYLAPVQQETNHILLLTLIYQTTSIFWLEVTSLPGNYISTGNFTAHFQLCVQLT
jgi:hypothetical protein